MATPEPCPGGWRALCLGARGDTKALPWWVACSVLRGTWRRRSPLQVGGVLCATEHVAMLEPSGTGSGSGAVGLVFYVLCTGVPGLQGTNGFFFHIVRSQGNGMMLLIVEIYLRSFLLLVWYRVEDVNSVRESSAELLYIKATDLAHQRHYPRQQKKQQPTDHAWMAICHTKRHSRDSSRLVDGAEQERGGVSGQPTTAASRRTGALAPHLPPPPPHLILSFAHTLLLLPPRPHPHLGPTRSPMPFSTQLAGHSTNPTPIPSSPSPSQSRRTPARDATAPSVEQSPVPNP
jgi:hypothetical protein